MTAIVYATPQVPPPVASTPRFMRMRITWEGWDGSKFELSNWKSGVFLTQQGTEGLGTPLREDWVSKLSPFVHGQEYQGFLVSARDIFLPLYLYAEGGSKEWMARDTAFWQTLRPGQYGTLSVETTAGVRTIRARYKEGGEAPIERDPHYFGWQRYGVTLVADDPFWYGGLVGRSWTQEPPKDFFGGEAKAPTFHISSASMLATATLSNPGDVEAWPVWDATGPFSSVGLGVDGRQFTYAGSVSDGMVFSVDSDPRDQTAYLDGVDVTGDLGSYDFAPIPPGESRSLTLSMAGTGTVKAEIRPRFFRAW